MCTRSTYDHSSTDCVTKYHHPRYVSRIRPTFSRANCLQLRSSTLVVGAVVLPGERLNLVKTPPRFRPSASNHFCFRPLWIFSACVTVLGSPFQAPARWQRRWHLKTRQQKISCKTVHLDKPCSEELHKNVLQNFA